jgi:D-aminopeptidase
MKKNVSVKIDGLFVIASMVAVVGVVTWYNWNEVKKTAQKVNPASKENFIYEGISEVVKNSTHGKSKGLGQYWSHKCKESNYKAWYCPGI